MTTDFTNKDYDFFVKMIMKGKHFYDLNLLQGAVEYKGNLNDYDRRTDYTDIFWIGTTKQEAIDAREEVIRLIVKALNEGKTEKGEEMLMDHYMRLFHGLAILKVDKSLNNLEKEKNKIYEAAYILWTFDNGSQEAGNLLMRSAWLVAEKCKEFTKA